MNEKENFIVGLYAADRDAANYLKDYYQDLTQKKCDCEIRFWWNQRPQGTEETLKHLRELIN